MKFGKAIEQIWLERPELQHVLELFVGPLWAAKQKPKGIESPAAFLREIRDGLGEADFEIAVLERAQKIAATRRTVMPALPECLAYCRQAADELVAERKVYEETRKTDLRRQADPGMAAHTDALRERLRNRLGRDVFESWFAGLECEAVAGAVLMASVPEKFVKTWIDGHYAEELRECAAAQFPGLGKVEIKSRAANARAA